MKQTHLAIIGSRGYQFRNAVDAAVEAVAKLNPFYEDGKAYSPVVIVSGGAPGPDTWAAELADFHGIPVEVIRPDYAAHPPKLAPKIRNREIARTCTHMLAFWDAGAADPGAESGGTSNAVTWAAFYLRRLRVFDSECATYQVEAVVRRWFGVDAS